MAEFTAQWCQNPSPNPLLEGCYRSELALNSGYIKAHPSVIDWETGVGSSERWFGFSNRIPANFTPFSNTEENGPSLQFHAGGGLPELKGKHPPWNLQVDGSR